ncbi:MAG TPA: lysophospholipid acyltransferase family protein [Nitrolancea sp.]|nr:lysophospholipid acyltransferase family protein [Nitrolancea sp.]
MTTEKKSLSERLWRAFRLSLYLGARPFVLFAFRLLFGFRIEGLENVPKKGGALVICNHIHNSDPILLVAAYPRPLLWMAKKEVFSVPVIGWIADSAGAFPVDRGSADRAAMRNAERLLKEHYLVGIFPEGTRSVTGGLKDVYPGVALVALKSGAPILPTAIIDSDRLPFNGHKGRRRANGRLHVTVRIGTPFVLTVKDAEGKRRDLAELTDEMMIEIAKLLPESYRGIYADRLRALESHTQPTPSTHP